MQNIFLYAAVWWLYSAVGTFLLGRQSGGRPLVWGSTGMLLGPLGMLAALLIPARSMDILESRWLLRHGKCALDDGHRFAYLW